MSLWGEMRLVAHAVMLTMLTGVSAVTGVSMFTEQFQRHDISAAWLCAVVFAVSSTSWWLLCPFLGVPGGEGM